MDNAAASAVAAVQAAAAAGLDAELKAGEGLGRSSIPWEMACSLFPHMIGLLAAASGFSTSGQATDVPVSAQGAVLGVLESILQLRHGARGPTASTSTPRGRAAPVQSSPKGRSSSRSASVPCAAPLSEPGPGLVAGFDGACVRASRDLDSAVLGVLRRGRTVL
eukprot:Hpha_TRINITY_DN36094_c0_g1::TRINITY_DN36094_c0_g1_i1::g.170846::m.170846